MGKYDAENEKLGLRHINDDEVKTKYAMTWPAITFYPLGCNPLKCGKVAIGWPDSDTIFIISSGVILELADRINYHYPETDMPPDITMFPIYTVKRPCMDGKSLVDSTKEGIGNSLILGLEFPLEDKNA